MFLFLELFGVDLLKEAIIRSKSAISISALQRWMFSPDVHTMGIVNMKMS